MPILSCWPVCCQHWFVRLLRLCTGDVAAKHWRRCVFRLRDLSDGIFRRLQRLDKLLGLWSRPLLDLFRLGFERSVYTVLSGLLHRQYWGAIVH